MHITTRILLPLVLVFATAGCLISGQPVIDVGNGNLNEPGTHSLWMVVDDLDRLAVVHVPDCYEPGIELPLVLVLHGSGDSARGMMKETDWVTQAEAACFLVVFPQGSPLDPNKPERFFSNPGLWNDGSGRFKTESDDIAFIQQLIEGLGAQLAVDQKRVYATGFSNGASMVFRLGVELNDTLAAIAPVAGALWQEDFSLDKPISLLYITGTADPLNPIEGGRIWPDVGGRWGGRDIEKPPVKEHIAKWAAGLDCLEKPISLEEVEGVQRKIYQGCKDGAEVQYYAVEGLGHQWPGGKRRLPEFLLGERSDIIDATSLIWSFFLDHSKGE